MSKRKKSNEAQEFLKDFLDNETNDTPKQSPIAPTKIKEKKETTRFTVEIETKLMNDVRLYGIYNDMKIRQIFELALKEFLKSNN